MQKSNSNGHNDLHVTTSTVANSSPSSESSFTARNTVFNSSCSQTRSSTRKVIDVERDLHILCISQNIGALDCSPPKQSSSMLTTPAATAGVLNKHDHESAAFNSSTTSVATAASTFDDISRSSPGSPDAAGISQPPKNRQAQEETGLTEELQLNTQSWINSVNSFIVTEEVKAGRPVDLCVLHLQEIGGKKFSRAFNAYLNAHIKGCFPTFTGNTAHYRPAADHRNELQEKIKQKGWCSDVLMCDQDDGLTFTAMGTVLYVSARVLPHASLLSFPHRTFISLLDAPLLNVHPGDLNPLHDSDTAASIGSKALGSSGSLVGLDEKSGLVKSVTTPNFMADAYAAARSNQSPSASSLRHSPSLTNPTTTSPTNPCLAGHHSHTSVNKYAMFNGFKFSNAGTSRKGYLHVALEIGSRICHFVNVHLFHDDDNTKAVTKSPSEYADRRVAAIVEMLGSISAHIKPHKDALFIFGDFNFRLDLCRLVKMIQEKFQTTLDLEKKKIKTKEPRIWEWLQNPVNWPELRQFDNEGERVMAEVAAHAWPPDSSNPKRTRNQQSLPHVFELAELKRSFGPTYLIETEPKARKAHFMDYRHNPILSLTTNGESAGGHPTETVMNASMRSSGSTSISPRSSSRSSNASNSSQHSQNGANSGDHGSGINIYSNNNYKDLLDGLDPDEVILNRVRFPAWCDRVWFNAAAYNGGRIIDNQNENQSSSTASNEETDYSSFAMKNPRYWTVPTSKHLILPDQTMTAEQQAQGYNNNNNLHVSKQMSMTQHAGATAPLLSPSSLLSGRMDHFGVYLGFDASWLPSPCPPHYICALPAAK